jgi:hypothetical protein
MGLKKKKKSAIDFWRILGVLGTALGVGVGLSAVVGDSIPGFQPFLDSAFGSLLDSPSDVSGQFVSTEALPLGAWTFAPDSCHSGEPSGFHGVWLTDGAQEGHGIRIAKDTDGSLIVSTQVPGTDQMVAFGGCQVSGAVNRTNTSLNDVWEMEGNVSIDCPNNGYSGSATFSGCL